MVPHVGLIWRVGSLLLALLLGLHGYKKKSLDASGAISAFVVGFIHLDVSLAAGLTLIFFYLSSSKLTKVQSERKAALEDDFKHGGQRNASQVLANSLGACLALLAVSWMQGSWGEGMLASMGIQPGAVSAFCVGGFLGHYSCCCADTWASEIGILSNSSPRLITTFRKVPPGTNGGVSMLGTACALAAGMSIGLVYYVFAHVEYLYATWAAESAVDNEGMRYPAAPNAHLIILLSVALGLFGCQMDSLLGATLQYSGFDDTKKKVVAHPGESVKHICGVPLLSNSAVNFVSAAISAVVGGILAIHLGIQ